MAQIELANGTLVEQPLCCSCRYCEKVAGRKTVCRLSPPMPSATTRDLAAHVNPDSDWCSSHVAAEAA